MLNHYLQSAISDINELIQLTQADIENIIQADHQKIFERTKIKEDLLASFNSKKLLIDSELKKLKAHHDSLASANIPDDTLELIEKLKEGFWTLKTENKRYAKFVLTVSEFYNSLLDKIAPHKEQVGYGSATYNSTFLKMSV